MDIYETRRENLRKLVDERAGGNMAEFGQMIGRDRAQMSQFLSASYNEGRSFGERVARDIEDKLGIERFSLDRTDAPTDKPLLHAVEQTPLEYTSHQAVQDLVEIVNAFNAASAGDRAMLLKAARTAAKRASADHAKTATDKR